MSEYGTTGSISFCGLLTILFIGLKLIGYISWSWWWVLSPLWISFIIVTLILVIGLFAFLKFGNITLKDLWKEIKDI